MAASSSELFLREHGIAARECVPRALRSLEIEQQPSPEVRKRSGRIRIQLEQTDRPPALVVQGAPQIPEGALVPQRPDFRDEIREGQGPARVAIERKAPSPHGITEAPLQEERNSMLVFGPQRAALEATFASDSAYFGCSNPSARAPLAEKPRNSKSLAFTNPVRGLFDWSMECIAFALPSQPSALHAVAKWSTERNVWPCLARQDQAVVASPP
eukprot:CAMPEP_0117579246 /NCGR_PEP_ID=MMETSP0784-20121206/64505_1 /TAXON_ID=39447 /ORGANISM="" /LENGTH=213 /DNA_ID=CAMNT_0005379105 /DNA_START=300 /DNA_END=938 /DNA_ORIENTATION=-